MLHQTMCTWDILRDTWEVTYTVPLLFMARVITTGHGFAEFTIQGQSPGDLASCMIRGMAGT